MVKFTEKDKKDLIRLLRMVRKNNFWLPNGKLMRAVHGTFSMWATEIVITRSVSGRIEILLAVYEGGAESLRGRWHIPGGYNKWPESDIQTTCSAVALRELGVDVSSGVVLTAYKWQEGQHPYGRPLSLFVDCKAKSSIKETEKVRFFAVDSLPKNLLEPHCWFIRKYFG